MVGRYVRMYYYYFNNSCKRKERKTHEKPEGFKRRTAADARFGANRRKKGEKTWKIRVQTHVQTQYTTQLTGRYNMDKNM